MRFLNLKPGILEDLGLTVEKDDLRIHLVNVTSGSWLPEVSNVPIWSHYLMIIVPLYSNVKLSGKAMLYSTEQVAPISGDITTTPTAEVAMRIAKESGSVTALLYGNPHGPLVFSDDARQDMELYGSSLLAYSWNKTLDRAQDKPEVGSSHLPLFINKIISKLRHSSITKNVKNTNSQPSPSC